MQTAHNALLELGITLTTRLRKTCSRHTRRQLNNAGGRGDWIVELDQPTAAASVLLLLLLLGCATGIYRVEVSRCMVESIGPAIAL
jgi:hypothetical protein